MAGSASPFEFRLPRESDGDWWKVIVCIGILLEDLTPATIARFGDLPVGDIVGALTIAEASGLIVDGAVPPEDGQAFVRSLPPDVVAAIHAAIAVELMAEGIGQLDNVLAHAHRSRGKVPLGVLVDYTDRAARAFLSLGDYRATCEALRVSEEHGIADAPIIRAHRACDLSIALDGLGDVEAARGAAARAFELASYAGDAGLAARAAIAYSFPVDWYAGDDRAAALLLRAEQMDLSDDDRVAVLAARATVEMRVPLAGSPDQQLAWTVRADLSQQLSDRALDESVGKSPTTRLVSLLSWRFTHMAPAFLERRRETATEAMSTAQALRNRPRQVEAALLLAVDHLESGNRSGFDSSLDVGRWVADRDGNPRLRWRTLAMTAGTAHLEGDPERAARFRQEAHHVGAAANVSGYVASDLLLFAEEIDSMRDSIDLSAFVLPDDSPALRSGIALAIQAQMLAHLGRSDEAIAGLRRSIRLLDSESSLLFHATQCARAAVAAGDREAAEQLVKVLVPWSDRFAVDAHAWWPIGPVALTLAELEALLGHTSEARLLLPHARTLIDATGDVRSRSRLEALVRSLDTASAGRQQENGLRRATVSITDLTDRERRVLALIALGRTNRDIASELSYSTSTVRNATVSLYRKLGASNRAEATSIAHGLGLV